MALRFELEGNSPDTINSLAVLCMLGLLLAFVLGFLLDCSLERVAKKWEGCSARRRPPGWAISLLIASYVLLLPGLTSCLFSFNMMLDFGIIQLGLGPGGSVDKAPAVTESMMGLIDLLKKTGKPTAAHAVILYALVIPTVKLVLLLLGQVLRSCPRAANCCTNSVQFISKWACPDMFAYILLLHLVRGMNHPRMLVAEMQLDVGFTCFSLFCIGSTVASLGIKAGDEGSGVCPGRGSCQWLAGEALMLIVMLLFLGFACCLWHGLSHPIMALRLHTEVLFKPKGPIPTTFWGMSTRPVVERLNIPEKANTDVSVVAAIQSLMEDAIAGEVNSMIGLVMLAFFVVALTLANMVLLLAIAFLTRCGKQAQTLIRVSVALKKLSMLDVLIMGVCVVTLCMTMYQKDGIFVTQQSGLYSLACAEVLHYITFYLVTCAPDRIRDDAVYSAVRAGEVTPSVSDTEAGVREVGDLLPKQGI